MEGPQALTFRYRQCGEETKDKVPRSEVEKMASNGKASEVMEWQQEEGGDELSQDPAPSVETGSTRLARSDSGGLAPRSPGFSICFLVK